VNDKRNAEFRDSDSLPASVQAQGVGKVGTGSSAAALKRALKGWRIGHPKHNWSVDDEDASSSEWTAVIDSKGRAVAFAVASDSQFFFENRTRANARLIAAAPELLEALRGVLRVADRNTDEFNAARAALAKATQL
jgi:hypothetical protein